MSEDIEDYQITPDDLGCLGEPECDPGVKEETQKVEKPRRLSFEHIPLKKKKRARKLYDAFEGEAKDMSFEDFCIELYALESPKLMQADLHNIVMEKQDRSRLAFANQHRIDRNMN